MRRITAENVNAAPPDPVQIRTAPREGSLGGAVVQLDQWRGLFRTAGWAAYGSVALTVVQVTVFSIWPPVHTAPELFALMDRSPLLGLLSMDVLFVVNNVLVLLVYLGLAVALWPVGRSVAAVAITLGLLQMAAYMASNPAVELLGLARSYAGATGERRVSLLAVGQGVLAAWKGTAFLVYYFLGAAVLLLFAVLLLRSVLFSRQTGWWAVAAGLLMIVPSTFGVVGLVFSLVSLLPWTVLCVLLGMRFQTFPADLGGGGSVRR